LAVIRLWIRIAAMTRAENVVETILTAFILQATTARRLIMQVSVG